MRSWACALWQGLEALWAGLQSGPGMPEVAWQDLSPQRALLSIGGRSWLVDGRARQLRREGRTVCRFEEVRYIDVLHHAATDDEPAHWQVLLRTGVLSSITLLRTEDDADASILAAGLATRLGKPVRSL